MTLTPDALEELQARAERLHPDELAATAREVLALVAEGRQAGALAEAVGNAKQLASNWAQSADIQQAAAGRIMLAALGGRQAALHGLADLT